MMIYMVALIRDNKIESIEKITKSQHLAHIAFLGTAKKFAPDKKKLLNDLLDLFAEEELTDNALANLSEDLNLQLYSWEG